MTSIKETDCFSEKLTIRDALIQAFDDDWNLRKKIENALSGDVIDIELRISVSIPIDLAKKIYKEFKESEK